MAAKELLYSSITNQKLAFARVQLKAAAAEAEESIAGRLSRHAHLDAAVAQLADALSVFVAEVGENYQLGLDPAAKSFAELLHSFEASGKKSSAITELLSLGKRRESWLAELMEARANPLALAQRFKTDVEEGDAQQGGHAEGRQVGLIPALNLAGPDAHKPGVNKPRAASPVELVGEWAQATQSLVDRQRSALHEE